MYTFFFLTLPHSWLLFYLLLDIVFKKWKHFEVLHDAMFHQRERFCFWEAVAVGVDHLSSLRFPAAVAVRVGLLLLSLTPLEISFVCR